MMHMSNLTMLASAFSAAAFSPVRAAEPPGGAIERSAHPATGLELWTSTDSDHTHVIKLLGRELWKFEGRDDYQGIAVEHVLFRLQSGETREENRLYLDFADDLGRDWRWKARVGTNGHTVLGSASVRTSDWRREFFIEREIVETPTGLGKGIYYSFVGTSLDFPAGDRDTFNTTAAVQVFTGKNVRLHVRGNYVHLVKPVLGLSVQLRTRYFHSTKPGEFDYYSPRNFVQVLPVAQMRRFDSAGWMFLVALGYGAQKATGAGWQSARLADLRIESPQRGRRFQAFAGLQYSNNSLSQGGGGYHYVTVRTGLTARL